MLSKLGRAASVVVGDIEHNLSKSKAWPSEGGGGRVRSGDGETALLKRDVPKMILISYPTGPDDTPRIPP